MKVIRTERTLASAAAKAGMDEKIARKYLRTDLMQETDSGAFP